MKIYTVLAYSSIWVILANNWFSSCRYQRELLICLQSGAISLLGGHILERWLFVFQEHSFGVVHNDVSPASLLIGAVLELVVLSILLISLAEVIVKKES